MADKRKTKKTKDSQLVIRMDREDRDQFVAVCDELDTSAAREIRRFIRSFMKDQQKASDGSPKGPHNARKETE